MQLSQNSQVGTFLNVGFNPNTGVFIKKPGLLNKIVLSLVALINPSKFFQQWEHGVIKKPGFLMKTPDD